MLLQRIIAASFLIGFIGCTGSSPIKATLDIGDKIIEGDVIKVVGDTVFTMGDSLAYHFNNHQPMNVAKFTLRICAYSAGGGVTNIVSQEEDISPNHSQVYQTSLVDYFPYIAGPSYNGKYTIQFLTGDKLLVERSFIVKEKTKEQLKEEAETNETQPAPKVNWNAIDDDNDKPKKSEYNKPKAIMAKKIIEDDTTGH
jgi:hypothetical protein